MPNTRSLAKRNVCLGRQWDEALFFAAEGPWERGFGVQPISSPGALLFPFIIMIITFRWADLFLSRDPHIYRHEGSMGG